MKLTKNELQKLITEILSESQYYKDAEDFDTEVGAQALELGSSMIDGDRDRMEQVEKYVGLKVKKELMKAIKGHTKFNLEGLIDFAAYMQDVDMYDMDDELNRRKAVAIRKAYEKVMRRPMEAADSFDGTQESLDKWMESIKSVQRILFKARDPGMTSLGQIVPETLEIGEPVRSEYGFYEPKIVRPKTAVKEATEYFRPAIMKTIVKSLDKKSGMNITDVFGINESLDAMFSSVGSANQALNLLIDAGMLPEPVKLEPNEQWGSIYIKFNSNEELQQLTDLLDEYGVNQQLGTSAKTPAYFVHKPLVNKRKQFYRSDEEPPKPPPPTGLTLKF